MTQKELDYVEDAIGHEDNIIKILEETKKNLQDTELVSFVDNELNTHATKKQSLISLLEGKINE